MNDDDIRWLNWIASTLYEEANRERMTRLVTTLTADLGRAREEIAAKDAEITRLTKLLTPYIQQEERLAWLIGDPSKQGVVMEVTEDPYIIINGQPSLRPAAKDDEGGAE